MANYFKVEKYINLYKEYTKHQNNLLKKIIKKINAANYDCLECQEINKNESEYQELFLMNIFKEIYDNKIKKSNNYNLYSFNFDYIERILVG